MRESLKRGDTVKLLFRVDDPKAPVDVERMWVEVTGVDGVGYSGRLANRPTLIRDLRPGDVIAFRAEHVSARDAGPDDPLYTDPNAFAVVSRRVWEQDAWPSRLERLPIPDPQFSGWFVMAGDESDAYKADATNFVPLPQAALFDRFRVLDSGLEGPVGSTLTWDDEALEYKVVA